MFLEAAQAHEAVSGQLARNEQVLAELAQSLLQDTPSIYLTCARGSSDHAATFLKYLFETQLNVVASSFSPAVCSVYSRAPPIGNGFCVVISQSGQSPDLLAVARQYKAQGSRIIALVNREDSPLAKLADFFIPLCAEEERSVAATKSFIAALFAILQVASRHPSAAISLAELQEVPLLLQQAWTCDWSALTGGLLHEQGLYVIGRGIGFAIAQEAALKLKETCGLHAEAFSAAEVRHGPMALLQSGMPLLIFRQADAAAESLDEFAKFAVKMGCRVYVAGGSIPGATNLPSQHAPPLIQPLMQIQSFYRAANQLAVARGLDPDSPPMLQKVTETI